MFKIPVNKQGRKGKQHKIRKTDLRWFVGCWLGKDDKADEHIIGTRAGTYYAISIRIMPYQRNWNGEYLKKILGTLADPKDSLLRGGLPKELVDYDNYMLKEVSEDDKPLEGEEKPVSS